MTKEEYKKRAEELAEEYLEIGDLITISETKGSYEEILDCLNMGDIISYLNSRGYKVED